MFHFLDFQQVLNILKKNMIVIANVLTILQTVKESVRPLSKKGRFRTSFDSQHFKTSEKLVKSAWEHFYHVFSSLWEDMSWKVSPLVKFEIFGVSINTLNAHDKYPVWDCKNLQVPIQM